MTRFVVFYGALTSSGGAERVAVEEAGHLGESDHARLVTFKADSRVLAYSSLALHGTEILRGARLSKYQGSILSRMRRAVGEVLALRRSLKTDAPDVVIGSMWGGWLHLYLASLLTRSRYVLHVHGTTFWFSGDTPSTIRYATIHRSVYRRVLSESSGHAEFLAARSPRGFGRVQLELLALVDYMAVRRAKAILVLSERMNWEVNQLYHRNAFVVPITAVSTSARVRDGARGMRERLGVGQGKVVFSVSRLERPKRIDLLVRSFAELAREDPDVILVVGGRGPEEEKLRRLASELGVQDRMRLVGFISEEELWDYYETCDVFAYPGIGDFAMTAFEALSLGKVIVCTTEMETKQYPNSASRFVVSPPNVHGYAGALKRALTMPSGPRLDPARYSWGRYVERVKRICLSVTR